MGVQALGGLLLGAVLGASLDERAGAHPLLRVCVCPARPARALHNKA